MASKQVKRVSSSMERFATRVMRQLTLRTWQAVTLANPVATGFSRAGWVPTTGSPEPGPSSSVASRTRGLSKEVMGKLATSQAKSLFKKNSALIRKLVAGYTLKQGATFIVNGVRYLEFLNRGSSAQAPAMFVQASQKQALQATKRALA